MCDACDYTIVDILGRKKDKKVHDIYYTSQKLNSDQNNYIIT